VPKSRPKTISGSRRPQPGIVDVSGVGDGDRIDLLSNRYRRTTGLSGRLLVRPLPANVNARDVAARRSTFQSWWTPPIPPSDSSCLYRAAVSTAAAQIVRVSDLRVSEPHKLSIRGSASLRSGPRSRAPIVAYSRIGVAGAAGPDVARVLPADARVSACLTDRANFAAVLCPDAWRPWYRTCSRS
jgi:hypothetical protein